MKKAFSLATLLVSLFIYLFYRSEKTVVNELLIALISYETYSQIKTSIIHFVPLSNLIIFSLPGGIWIFCATVFSQGFYMNIGRWQFPLVLMPILFAVVLELFQLFHLTNGRFDYWDLVFYVLFWLLATYSFPIRSKKENIWAPFTFHGFVCLLCLFSVYLAHVSY